MKLEFIAEAFEGDGLLLLHSGSDHEVGLLRSELNKLSTLEATCRVDALSFVDPVDDCELVAVASEFPVGVTRLGAFRMEWSLSPSEWNRVADLLEPFCASSLARGKARFQYLHEQGGVEVIDSTERSW